VEPDLTQPLALAVDPQHALASGEADVVEIERDGSAIRAPA